MVRVDVVYGSNIIFSQNFENISKEEIEDKFLEHYVTSYKENGALCFSDKENKISVMIPTNVFANSVVRVKEI